MILIILVIITSLIVLPSILAVSSNQIITNDQHYENWVNVLTSESQGKCQVIKVPTSTNSTGFENIAVTFELQNNGEGGDCYINIHPGMGSGNDPILTGFLNNPSSGVRRWELNDSELIEDTNYSICGSNCIEGTGMVYLSQGNTYPGGILVEHDGTPYQTDWDLDFIVWGDERVLDALEVNWVGQSPLNNSINTLLNLDYFFNISEVANCSFYWNDTFQETKNNLASNTTYNFSISKPSPLFENITSYIECNGSNGINTNSTTKYVYWNLTLTKINLTILDPLTNINVTQNTFFNVSVNVTCLESNCDLINVSLDPISFDNNLSDKTIEYIGPSARIENNNLIIDGKQNYILDKDGKYKPCSEVLKYNITENIIILDFGMENLTFNYSYKKDILDFSGISEKNIKDFVQFDILRKDCNFYFTQNMTNSDIKLSKLIYSFPKEYNVSETLVEHNNLSLDFGMAKEIQQISFSKKENELIMEGENIDKLDPDANFSNEQELCGPQIYDTIIINNSATITACDYVGTEDGNGTLIFQATNIHMEEGTTINGNEKGFRGSETSCQDGEGPGGAIGTGCFAGAGGSYGGYGGNASTGDSISGDIYGNSTNVSNMGSGGASGNDNDRDGGDGGGFVTMNATNILNISGTINVNGQAATEGGSPLGGGGSGGGVRLIGDSFYGNITINSVGGNSGNEGGAGGGGRIHVSFCNNNSANITYDIDGGTVEGGGNVGTVGSFVAEQDNNLCGIKGRLISNITGDTPFYTTEINPRNISLSKDESVVITWSVNATGKPDIIYDFFVFANLTSDQAVNNESFHFNVTIKSTDSCSCPSSGNWYVVCSDGCTINETCDMQGNNFSFRGNGVVTLQNNITNFTYGIIEQSCYVGDDGGSFVT